MIAPDSPATRDEDDARTLADLDRLYADLVRRQDAGQNTTTDQLAVLAARRRYQRPAPDPAARAFLAAVAAYPYEPD
ncbi:hypothetical protein [Raineyella fluvialis]|uniref:Uncharacterized protein n=1 Tax=Raineyella fluvialis TaxID=2662261 RepID=A0A5Q2FCD8_9ACTN|nr:hypothetical protein [Raineyella fluvialis]QGF24740.1 hypothetical protein Rai3103_15125 [Raineyella fluvialis]